MKLGFALILISLQLISCTSQNEFPKLEGPYFGQTPPGGKAELFAFELLTVGGNEPHIIVSPDSKEILFSVTTPKGTLLTEPKGIFGSGYLMYSKLSDGVWTEPTEFLPNRGYRIHYPAFSPDGERLIFNSFGKRDKPSDKPESRIWYIDRIEDGWSEPREVKFGPEYKGEGTVYPTLAANGSIYFTQWPDREHGYMYVSRLVDGEYTLPEKLSENINQYGGNHPYIAPDESFIIYDWEIPGKITKEGANDLYISFRGEDGEFMKPVNLGQGVNSVHDERRAFVTADGKYLFFASARTSPDKPKDPVSITELRKFVTVPQNSYQHLYWAEAKIIDDLKPKEESLN